LRGLKSIGFWDAEHAQDWGLDWHRHEGIQLGFLASGRISVAIDDEACCLEPDDMTITRPWQRHRLGDPNVGASRLHWLIFDVGVRRPNQPWKWPSWKLGSTITLCRPPRATRAPVRQGTPLR